MAGSQRPTARQRREPRPKETLGGEPVRVWLLGGFRVSVGSRSIGEEDWRLKKAASLLKLLALAPGHRMHREQAIELLWPDLEPEAALNNLHHALHVARRTLESSAPAREQANSAASRYLLHLRDERLALCPEGSLWVDVEAFEEAAAVARRALEPAAFRAAIDLYSGELLPEDRYELWAEERRVELGGLYHALLIELAGLYEERKEYESAIEALQRVVADEPVHEEAHVGLMRLYALLGRRREALKQYEVLREALSRELEAKPSADTRRLYEEVRAGSFPAAPTTPSSSSAAGRPALEPAEDSSLNNLPASLTSFVGREREVLEVKRLLSMTRLLTLTGMGGSGKTRLALEVARDLVGTYPEGVWLVELAPLSDPALVAHAVTGALGVREQPGRSIMQTLSNYLAPRQMLLALDNCEHLIDAAAHLADTLLSSCPKLRVLATSRERLSVSGEVIWQVPPLSLPEGDQEGEEEPTIEGLMRYEAVRLFLDRARSRLPGFELTQENAGATARVCRKLEGIPLAIELASARMGALAVEQVAQRLEDSLKLLTGGGRTVEPRQQTLRATLDWSFELLSEAERRLFGRLSVFAGGWTLEAAEEVCSSGEEIQRDEVVDLLSKLVDKSLVMAEAPSSPGASGEALRYRMLEPIRQYGRERLEEGGEAERLRERHAWYYLKLAERVEPELMGNRPAVWLKLLEAEYGNLRAALSWALDVDEEEEPAERAEVGLRLAAALGRFWDAYGAGEGRRWLEKGLASGDAAPASVRAKALNEAGFIAVYQGDPKAMALLEEGLTLYKELGDTSGLALSISYLGHAVLQLGHHERILSLREEVEELLSEPLGRRERALLLQFLGFAAASEMNIEPMKAHLEEALPLFRDLGDARSIAQCLVALGIIPLSQGDSERAEVLFEECLLLTRELNKTAIFFGLAGMMGVAVLRDQSARVAKLFGAMEALREEIGLSRAALSIALYQGEGYIASARAGLGEVAFEAAFSEGQKMSPEEAIEYALSKEEERKTPPTALVSALEQQHQQQIPLEEPTERLTPREREVALLVGRDLTNRKIAEELSISEHTVANHVRKILKKLKLRSRAQISSSFSSSSS